MTCTIPLQFTRIEFGTPAFDEAVGLRYIALRKPLGMEYNPAQLAEEYDTIHLGAYGPSGILLAYLNLVPQEEGRVKMRQVVVHPDYHRKGIGAELVEYSEEIARDEGLKRMELHAREVAVPFYLALSYEIEGERFEEVGIPHFSMWKALG